MKQLKNLFVILMVVLLISSVASAAAFDWMKNFNIRAEADPSGFRAQLETRFKIGDLEIKTVLGNVEKPADAYMLFRLGEMSNQPLDRVIEAYNTQNGKGWGSLAQSLGIKPGSSDFKALKNGQDLYYYEAGDKSNSKGKSKGRGRNK
jgi:hypothetical protein